MLVIATLIVLDVGLSLAKLNARPLHACWMAMQPWWSSMGNFCTSECAEPG